MSTPRGINDGPALMAAAAAETARVVGEAARTTTLNTKTPCTDWDLRALLNHTISSTPAADIAAMLIMEMVLHGWDIARATGQEYRAGDALARALLETVQAQAELFRQYQGFAEAKTIPDGASAFDRALSLSGRDPHWTP
jgi:hypothetical protein